MMHGNDPCFGERGVRNNNAVRAAKPAEVGHAVRQRKQDHHIID